MKKPKTYSVSLILSASLVVLVLGIVFGVMLLDFEGVIRLHLKIDGGYLEIDNRSLN